jgi:hypothetical protein
MEAALAWVDGNGSSLVEDGFLLLYLDCHWLDEWRLHHAPIGKADAFSGA